MSGGQSQEAAPGPLDDPPAQSVHEALPLLREEKEPLGQAVQAVAPCVEYSPAAQVSQEVPPLIQDPAGHGLQMSGLLPPQSGKVSAGQGVMQVLLPQAGTVPVGHIEQ